MGLKAAGFALFLSLLAVAPAVSPHEAKLTRFGPEAYDLVRIKPTTYSALLKAIDGPAKLVLQDESIDNAWIKNNGRDVVEPQDFSGNGEVIVDLNLIRENTIETKGTGR